LDAAILQEMRPHFSEYAIRKNAVYLPYDKELPRTAIENAVKQCLETKRES